MLKYNCFDEELARLITGSENFYAGRNCGVRVGPSA
jgi:hypothetical protein